MHSDIIPVIDLFAGPGGLGEGFSQYSPKKKYFPFKIGASVEMDPFAHKTLELRSFFHEFLTSRVPDEYYKYLRQEISRDDLFNKYPVQAELAKKTAIKATLGTDDDTLIYQRIEEVLSGIKGKPWVLIGGPPCQAYSLIGRSRRQAKGIGQETQQNDKRNFLYLEYLKIIAKFSPTVFVMENVKGMLSAEINGEKIVNKIFKDLRNPSDAISENDSSTHQKLGYKIYSLVTSAESENDLNPNDYLIHSEKYGIPQARHRVILLGIRNDFDVRPELLKPQKKVATVKELISDLPPLRSFFTRTEDSESEWYSFIHSIVQEDWFEHYKPAVRNGRTIEPEKIKLQMKDAISRLKPNLSTGNDFIKAKLNPNYHSKWFLDRRIRGVVNHSARGHMKEDLLRYFFSSIYAEIYGYSPRMKDFPKQLLPLHKNVQTQAGIDLGHFADRFRVQDADHPAATITCHMAKDGHYSIHYDPTQCRSLTVREAARLQTFPDNYYFEGPRTQQYHQVGNAVPPLLAVQVAKVVFKVITETQQANDKHLKTTYKNKEANVLPRFFKVLTK